MLRHVLSSNLTSVNLKDPRTGNTPLHHCLLPDFFMLDRNRFLSIQDCVQLLLSMGADPNLSNRNGYAPVHLAAMLWYTDPLFAMLDTGHADLNLHINNSERLTPVLASLRGMRRWAFTTADWNVTEYLGYTAMPLYTTNDGHHLVSYWRQRQNLHEHRYPSFVLVNRCANTSFVLHQALERNLCDFALWFLRYKQQHSSSRNSEFIS